MFKNIKKLYLILVLMLVFGGLALTFGLFNGRQVDRPIKVYVFK